MIKITTYTHKILAKLANKSLTTMHDMQLIDHGMKLALTKGVAARAELPWCKGSAFWGKKIYMKFFYIKEKVYILLDTHKKWNLSAACWFTWLYNALGT